MKPLELTVWPRRDIGGNLGGPAYKHPEHSGQIMMDKASEMARQKRLTDADLAAEYWRAVALGEWLPIAYTLNRFATTPSYDEETR